MVVTPSQVARWIGDDADDAPLVTSSQCTTYRVVAANMRCYRAVSRARPSPPQVVDHEIGKIRKQPVNPGLLQENIEQFLETCNIRRQFIAPEGIGMDGQSARLCLRHQCA